MARSHEKKLRRNKKGSPSKSVQKPTTQITKVVAEKLPRKGKEAEHLNLAAAFSDAVEQSKKCILTATNERLNQTIENLCFGVSSIAEATKLEEGHIANERQSHITPPGEQVLEWRTADGHIGDTTLGLRMKKLEKAVRRGRESIMQDAQELAGLDDGIYALAVGIFGTDGAQLLLSDMPDTTNVLEHSQTELRSGMEDHRRLLAQKLEDANAMASKCMQESEEKLNLRQQKAQESFYAILRDENF